MLFNSFDKFSACYHYCDIFSDKREKIFWCFVKLISSEKLSVIMIFNKYFQYFHEIWSFLSENCNNSVISDKYIILIPHTSYLTTPIFSCEGPAQHMHLCCVCPFVCLKPEFLTVWSAYDSLWQLMTTYDSLWQLMTAYDSLWQLMTTFSNFWQLMTANDNLWQLMTTFDNLYLYTL